MSAEEYRMLLLKFIHSLTVCDHMGDVADDIDAVLKRMGEKIEWGDLYQLGQEMEKRGIPTLWVDS